MSTDIGRVQSQVEEVTNVVHEAVQVAIDNNSKASDLEDKSTALAAQASAFHKNARATRKMFWWQNFKERLCVLGVCGTLLLLLLITILPKGSGTIETPPATESPVTPTAGLPFEEGFDDAVAVPNATYTDKLGYKCAHQLRPDRGARTVYGAGERDTGDLGFVSYYVDSLGATGSAPLHTATGADIGVDDVAGRRAFALRARGTDGFLFVCTRPVRLSAPSLRAEATVYVAQAGWHEEVDEMRLWASVSRKGRDTEEIAISLLPGCAATATRHTVDTLGLRASTLSAAYTGEPMGVGDPSLLADRYNWQTLGVELGAVEDTSVRVCAGLQSGAGAEALYVDSFALRQGAAAVAGCLSQTVLAGVASDFTRLAVRGSCAEGEGHSGMIVVGVLLSGGALAFLFWAVQTSNGAARAPGGARSVEITASRPFA